MNLRASFAGVIGSVLAATMLLGAAQSAIAQAPAGEVTVSFHVTLEPTWCDPSTAPPQITPFGVLYAVPRRAGPSASGAEDGASLAESWTESPDGLVYEFKLRRGLKFHNGDPSPPTTSGSASSATRAGGERVPGPRAAGGGR